MSASTSPAASETNFFKLISGFFKRSEPDAVVLPPPKTVEETRVHDAAGEAIQNALTALKTVKFPPAEKILEDLDYTLAVFNTDFLTPNLRKQMWSMLSNTESSLRLLDIFYETNFDLAVPYGAGKFEKSVYTIKREQFLHDVEQYIVRITVKIEELSALREILYGKSHEMRVYNALSRIEAIVSILQRPIPMMSGLLAEARRPQIRLDQLSGIGSVILHNVVEN